MRANSATKEPAMQEWWASEGVYEEIASRRTLPVFAPRRSAVRER